MIIINCNLNNKISNKKNFYFFPNFWTKNFELIKTYNLLLNKEIEQNINFIFFFTILNPTKFKKNFNQKETKLLLFPSKILKKHFLELTKNNVFVCFLNKITDIFFFTSLLSSNSIFLMQLYFKKHLLSVSYFFVRLTSLKKNYFLLAKNIKNSCVALGYLNIFLKQILSKIIKNIIQILLYQA